MYSVPSERYPGITQAISRLDLLHPKTQSMAKKVAIAGSRELLKKNVALLLIRRGMAYWVEPGSVIARRAAKTSIPVDIRFELHAAPDPPAYVPEHLPAAELPGIKFEQPIGASGRRLTSGLPQLNYLSRSEQWENLMADSSSL